jgi:hypothetical protein
MVKKIKEFLKYQLDPEDLEQRYREGKLANDKGLAITIIAFMLFILTVFVFVDLHFLDKGFSLYASVTSRCVTLVISLLAAWMVYCQSKTRAFDLIMLAWTMVVISHMLIVSVVRPEHFVTLYAYDILVILGIYSALPIPLSFQLLPSLVLTGGSCVLWLSYKAFSWDSLETGATLGAYFITNIFGIYLSSRLKKSDRKKFVLLMQEKEAKAQLENTLDEVKVLRGIIPICVFCKKIRNDEAYYEAVEAYVKRHSEADFSHTYCPDCMKEHYPELQ